MKYIYRLEGLCCANCAAKMEEKISRLEGVKLATVNLFSRKMTIETEADLIDGIQALAEKIIRKIEPDVVVWKEAVRE